MPGGAVDIHVHRPVDDEGHTVQAQPVQIKGKELVTAPKENVLAGVTRQTVIAIARKNGYSIVEEDIPLSSLNNFDGAFLTGTSAKIIPIKRISDNTFPEIVPNLKGLMLMYDDFLSTCGGVFDEAKY